MESHGEFESAGPNPVVELILIISEGLFVLQPVVNLEKNPTHVRTRAVPPLCSQRAAGRKESFYLLVQSSLTASGGIKTCRLFCLKCETTSQRKKGLLLK